MDLTIVLFYDSHVCQLPVVFIAMSSWFSSGLPFYFETEFSICNFLLSYNEQFQRKLMETLKFLSIRVFYLRTTLFAFIIDKTPCLRLSFISMAVVLIVT